MPLLNVYTSARLPAPAKRETLLRGLSTLVARAVGKPERWVMVALEPRAEMLFAGTRAPACYAELKNVGRLSGKKVAAIMAELCPALAKGLRVPQDRVYVEFTNASGALWGWNGETFG
jgi:phenylpyruvate tautomerase PptA (4-oxalocrotonate tautomerase family)